MTEAATNEADPSALTVVELLHLLRDRLEVPRSLGKRKNDIIAHVKQSNPALYSELCIVAGEKNRQKRKRVEAIPVERAVRRKVLHRCANVEAGCKNLDEFMRLPDDAQKQAIYRRFFEATSNAGVAMMICGVCAREVDAGIRDDEDSTPRRLDTLPNVHRLVPRVAHPAHTLYQGKLLEPKGVVVQADEIRVRVCSQCSASLLKAEDQPPKFSLANNLWIGPVPWHLQVLTFPEQLLIALLYPCVFVFKLHPRVGGRDPTKLQRGMRGTVSTYELDSDGITSMLVGDLMPRPPAVLASVISVTYIGVGQLPKNWLCSTFRVRRNVVFNVLHWLKENNPKYYGSISIDSSRLAALPDNDVPIEVLSLVRQTEDTDVVARESDGYLSERHTDEQADGFDLPASDSHAAGKDVSQEGDNGGPDGIPLDITGTIDTDLSSLSTNEMMQWGLANLWKRGEEGSYAVQHGSRPVSDFGRPQLKSGEPPDPDRANFFERAYPSLYPYGVGGLEADRPVDVKFAAPQLPPPSRGSPPAGYLLGTLRRLAEGTQ
ncbi:unnamed protein product [Mycena citricolor]|uniref:DUF6570 domain-containing protein n=1 Tax=Mycena citricolor TaxID=2018698 RepID=A0AAD2HRS1_9AGAR|nr:unnamed protein product [Mycena citricolor]